MPVPHLAARGTGAQGRELISQRVRGSSWDCTVPHCPSLWPHAPARPRPRAHRG